MDDTEDQMSKAEIAALFDEVLKEELPNLPATMEELEKLEDESNDIYKVAARIKNEVRLVSGKALTKAGEMFCNEYVHVCLSFYRFSETLPEPKKQELKDLVRKSENVPARLVVAGKNR